MSPDLDNDYPTEVAGEVELEFTDSSDDSSDEQDRTLTDPKLRKHTTFHEELPDMPCPNITQSHPELETMSEYEIWRKMFDDDMLHVLHEQTLLYARRDKGNPQFNVTSDEVMNFLGILLFSGYHSVPAARNFWSNQLDLKVPFVSNVMTRDTFDRLKTYMHLADNNNLMEGNKLAKVQPIYDVMNRNLTQFGFFHNDLSIDESMVPYYGKHSAKIVHPDEANTLWIQIVGFSGI